MKKAEFIISIFIAVGVLISTPARPCDGSGLFDQLQQPYSMSRTEIRSLNNAIGALLLKMPSVSKRHVSHASVCETYLLIARQYFKGALFTRDVALKSVLVLHGDRLVTSYPEFSALVRHTLAHPNTLAAANKALVKFQRATTNFNVRLLSWQRMDQFENRYLGPLSPLAAVHLLHTKTLLIWPTEKTKKYHLAPVTPATAPPPISQTIASLPSINIASKLRHVFAGVLRQIQTRLSNDPHDTKAIHYYRIIIRCLGLAQHLQQVSLLSLSTQKAFNHRLMLALLFFKDPRTRAGALRRLEFIGRIVDSMELISVVRVSPAHRAILDRLLHHIMTHLDRDENNRRYARELDAIDSFLRSAAALSAMEAKRVRPPYQEAQSRIALAGRKLLSSTIKTLRDNFSIHQLHTTQMELQVIAGNLQRVASMPAARDQALLYHPQLPAGVTRNTIRWARKISIEPAVISHSADEFDRFQQTLNLLAAIHLQLLHHAPKKTLDELSAHRYTQFLVLFHHVQRDIINSLSTMHPAPNKFTARLNDQMRLLRAVHRLAWLVDQRQYLSRLNIWGAWQWNHAARQMWRRQMEEVVAHRFEHDTGVKGASDASMSFASAAPAIKTLYRAVRRVAPKLRAGSKLWAVAYQQVISRPPANAIAATHWTNFTEACMWFNDAAANESHGHFQPAIDLFRRGNRILAAIPMRQP